MLSDSLFIKNNSKLVKITSGYIDCWKGVYSEHRFYLISEFDM